MNNLENVPMNGNSLAPVTSLSVQSKTKLHLCYTKNQTLVPYLLFTKKRREYGL